MVGSDFYILDRTESTVIFSRLARIDGRTKEEKRRRRILIFTFNPPIFPDFSGVNFLSVSTQKEEMNSNKQKQKKQAKKNDFNSTLNGFFILLLKNRSEIIFGFL